MRDELDRRHFSRHDRLTGEISLPNLQTAPRDSNYNRDGYGLGSLDINDMNRDSESRDELDFINQISRPMVSKKYAQRNTLDYNNLVAPRENSFSSSTASYQEGGDPVYNSDSIISRKDKVENSESYKIMQSALSKQTELLSKLITSIGNQKSNTDSEPDIALKLKLQELEKNSHLKDEMESLKQQMMLQQMYHLKRDERRNERATNINRTHPPPPQCNYFNK